MNEKALLAQLAQPFPPEAITWKPGSITKDGNKCMALAYADLRVYQERLDKVCGIDWSVRYMPWSDSRIICELTIYVGDALGRRDGILRSSTGEMDEQDKKNGMGGTVAEAQAMKRAAAQFGLGRYLYDLPSVWVEFDSQRKRISDAGQKELDARYTAWYARQTAQQAPQPPATGNRATTTPDTPQGASVTPTEADGDGDELDKLHRHLHALGKELYNGKWDEVRHRNAKRVSQGRTESSAELTPDEVQALIDGMNQLKAKRQVA